MADTGRSKISYLLERLSQGVAAHNRENPEHHTWGVGMSHFDIERLGLEEGEEILPGIILQSDGGVTGNFRVLCDGDHNNEEEEGRGGDRRRRPPKGLASSRSSVPVVAARTIRRHCDRRSSGRGRRAGRPAAPWDASAVTAHWHSEPFEPDAHSATAADRVLEELRDRGSPAYDGMSARLISFEQTESGLSLELQPIRWSLRLGDGAAGSPFGTPRRARSRGPLARRSTCRMGRVLGGTLGARCRRCRRGR